MNVPLKRASHNFFLWQDHFVTKHLFKWKTNTKYIVKPLVNFQQKKRKIVSYQDFSFSDKFVVYFLKILRGHPLSISEDFCHFYLSQETISQFEQYNRPSKTKPNKHSLSTWFRPRPFGNHNLHPLRAIERCFCRFFSTIIVIHIRGGVIHRRFGLKDKAWCGQQFF